MKNLAIACTLVLLGLSTSLYAQNEPGPSEDGERSLYDVIVQITHDMNVETIIDPRLRGLRVYRVDEDIDYETLLGILRINSFVVIETADQLLIVPDQNARSAPTRILQEDDSRVSDHEVVTRIVTVPEFPNPRRPEEPRESDGENPFATVPPSSAAQLVPVLRPMMSQSAMLGAVMGTNQLIMVDRYDNVRRITAIIEEIAEGLDD